VTVRRLALIVAGLAALACAPGASAAVWCGTDRPAADRADISTGAQVHLVYAIPSDGADDFAAGASAIASDVESVDAWWRGQDPTRTPRFDFASFPACTGFGAVDVSFVQLPLSSAQLFAASGRYTAIFRAIPSFGRWKKTVVYYDGPIEDVSLCGSGGGSTTTGSDSLAVVFSRASCSRTQPLRAAVLAHELTHELGYPDGRQPHPCPGDTGHACDSSRDLMYPFLSVGSIDELVLDVNRDDYYRGGTTNDLSASNWLRHLEGPQQALSVTVVGNGKVTSDLPGIACIDACSSQWDVGSRIVLAPVAADGQRFVGWKGGCAGPDCALTLVSAVSVQAVFAPLPRIRVAVSGKGRVTGRGIACPRLCTSVVDAAGFPLALVAAPAAGWRFAGWTGGCRATRVRCTVVPEADVSVRARFVRR
jgi:hypothetical protein